MSKKNPLVSVLTASYNHADFVIQALDSALEDNYPNKEFIIIDDGSTDSSVSKIKKWVAEHESKYKITFITRENRGLPKTLNEMLNHAKGKYIIYLASDDYLINNAIEEQVTFLENNPKKLCVFADTLVVDRNGNQIMQSSINELHKGCSANYGDDKSLRNEIVRNWAISSPRMEDASIYEKIGKFDEKLLIDDWNMYLKMVAFNVLGYIDKPLAAYRVHDNNTFSYDKEKSYDSIKKHIEGLKSLQMTIIRNIRLFDLMNQIFMIVRIVKLWFKILKLKRKLKDLKQNGK